MSAKVILADTDTSSRLLLKKLLSIFGLDCEAVDSGLSALKLAAEQPAPLMILDLNLPDIDGFLLCEIMHQVPRFKDTSVILLGNSIDQKTLNQGMRSGAQAFLERPVSAESLKGLIGLAKPETIEGIHDAPLSIEAALKGLALSGKQVLTLLFGQQARVLKIERLTPDYEAKHWDVVAKCTLMGSMNLEIATAATKESAQVVASAMGHSALLEPQTTAAVEALLETVVKRSLRDLQGKLGALKVTSETRTNTAVWLNEASTYRFAVHLRVGFQSVVLKKQLAIPLYVTFSVP